MAATIARVSDRLVKITVPWTSSSGGAFTEQVQLNGSLVRANTDPDGTAAPTDNYDITLVDVDGFDVAAGALLDRDTANNEQVVPTVPIPVAGTHTVTVANAGDTKKGVLVLYVTP